MAHLRRASLPGGDAAAQHPVQAAAGFLAQIDDLPDMSAAPFNFPSRYQHALGASSKRRAQLYHYIDRTALRFGRGVVGIHPRYNFRGTSCDVAGGFGSQRRCARERIRFHLQTASWIFARYCRPSPKTANAAASDREIARAFQRGVAQGLCAAIKALSREQQLDTVVLSGGVFQNELLLSDVRDVLSGGPLAIWTNHAVPPNDGGISLGQAALAAFGGNAARIIEGDA